MKLTMMIKFFERTFRVLLLILCFVGVMTWDSWSHPLGNFSLNHYNSIEIFPGEIITQHVLDFAEIPSLSELNILDTDGDNIITRDEILTYDKSIREKFVPQYSFFIIDSNDVEHPIQPEILQSHILLSKGQGALTCLQVQLAFSLKSELLKKIGDFTFRFQDNNVTHLKGIRDIRVKAYEGIILKQEGIRGEYDAISIDNDMYLTQGLTVRVNYHSDKESYDKQIDLTNVMTLMDPRSVPQYPIAPDENGNFKVIKTSVKPQQEVQSKIAMLQPREAVSIEALEKSNQSNQSQAKSNQLSTIQNQRDNSPYSEKGDEEWAKLISEDELSFTFIVFALGVSILFGAAHALSPGHGKTVVAAYLVGSKGTVWHAIFLGIIVTLTHVSSVLILGLIALYFTNSMVPDKYIGIIEIVSGGLIVSIGLSLFIRRFTEYQRKIITEQLGVSITHQHDRTHSHDNHHDHNHNHSHEHQHNHTHDHPHDHDHHHDHNHDHDHHHHGWLDHEHGPHTHTHEIPADATWRDLLVLGITGGIVPCPTAIVVLLAAIALNRVAFGMLLIIFFSMGLAAVLIAIGIMMVKAKALLDRFIKGEGSYLWLQVLSSVLVTILGLVFIARGMHSAGYITINFF
jgi:ABC-type nickel/cobalt efflux system permease component RcnA